MTNPTEIRVSVDGRAYVIQTATKIVEVEYLRISQHGGTQKRYRTLAPGSKTYNKVLWVAGLTDDEKGAE